MLSSLKPKISLPARKIAAVVGVDIDTDSVAAAFRRAHDARPQTAVGSLPEGAFRGGEIVDVDLVSAGLRDLFAQGRMAKQVRLAVASQGVSFRTLRLPLIENPDQLRSAVRFQAQEQIPMPLDSAVIDHQVIGAHVAEDGSRQIDVAVVAARRTTIDTLLRAARGAGLDPVGIDLSAFGMIRALSGDSAVLPVSLLQAGADAAAARPATLYCALGGVTNLAIARSSSCLFSRVAQFSVRGIAEELAASAGLAVDHAQQWLLYVGFELPIEQIDGDPAIVGAARSILESNLPRLADELRLSLDYYGGQEGAAPVDDVVLCGWGSAIHGIEKRLGLVLGRDVRLGRPEALSSLEEVEAARLTLPYGLSLER